MESIANRPVRRIVTADGADGRSLALSDGAVDDVLRDPARRGYQSTRVWATDRPPAVALTAQAVAHLPGLLEPPPGGALFRIVTNTAGRGVGVSRLAGGCACFFEAAGAAHAWCGAGARHLYMQQSRALELCVVLPIRYRSAWAALVADVESCRPARSSTADEPKTVRAERVSGKT